MPDGKTTGLGYSQSCESLGLREVHWYQPVLDLWGAYVSHIWSTDLGRTLTFWFVGMVVICVIHLKSQRRQHA
jgi:hypothetical protein